MRPPCSVCRGSSWPPNLAAVHLALDSYTCTCHLLRAFAAVLAGLPVVYVSDVPCVSCAYPQVVQCRCFRSHVSVRIPRGHRACLWNTALESHHWQLKWPQRLGFVVTRCLDYKFVTLTTDVSFYYQTLLSQQVHGEPTRVLC
jgi:hypothetical protein